jgi:hypothetical protein
VCATAGSGGNSSKPPTTTLTKTVNRYGRVDLFCIDITRFDVRRA